MKLLERKFDLNDTVMHLKTRGKYKIWLVPCDEMKLEDGSLPFYAYYGKDGVRWYRCQSEMEDGRFKLVKRCNNEGTCK